MKLGMILLILVIFHWPMTIVAEDMEIESSFELSYSFRPLGPKPGSKWLLSLNPNGELVLSTNRQIELPNYWSKSCTPMAGKFVMKLKEEETQRLLNLAKLAVNELSKNGPKEIRRNTASFALRTEFGEEVSTRLIEDDEGPKTQDFFKALGEIIPKLYGKPVQALKMQAERQKDHWQVQFVSMAKSTQSLLLPAKASEVFFLLNEKGERTGKLEYLSPPKKSIIQLKPGAKVEVAIKIPPKVSEGTILLYDNSGISHHSKNGINAILCQ